MLTLFPRQPLWSSDFKIQIEKSLLSLLRNFLSPLLCKRKSISWFGFSGILHERLPSTSEVVETGCWLQTSMSTSSTPWRHWWRRRTTWTASAAWSCWHTAWAASCPSTSCVFSPKGKYTFWLEIISASHPQFSHFYFLLYFGDIQRLLSIKFDDFVSRIFNEIMLINWTISFASFCYALNLSFAICHLTTAVVNILV